MRHAMIAQPTASYQSDSLSLHQTLSAVGCFRSVSDATKHMISLENFIKTYMLVTTHVELPEHHCATSLL